MKKSCLSKWLSETKRSYSTCKRKKRKKLATKMTLPSPYINKLERSRNKNTLTNRMMQCMLTKSPNEYQMLKRPRKKESLPKNRWRKNISTPWMLRSRQKSSAKSMTFWWQSTKGASMIRQSRLMSNIKMSLPMPLKSLRWVRTTQPSSLSTLARLSAHKVHRLAQWWTTPKDQTYKK